VCTRTVDCVARRTFLRLDLSVTLDRLASERASYLIYRFPVTPPNRHSFDSALNQHVAATNTAAADNPEISETSLIRQR
jgi:hypothetical protein